MDNKISENKRSCNFSKEEYLLVSLVENHKEVIECKKSNITTWKDKEKTWQTIETEFNSSSGRNGYKTVKTLKGKYSNLKKKTKRKFSENKMKITQTGGGCYVPIPVSDIDTTIKDIIGEQIDGLNNTYDSDTNWWRLLCTNTSV
ncbi:hypothetical protein NQ314_017587 [Rhamnusium bicolor]|uniref:Regulatory protein zeste n=1 Tax=Rhamnusium bicolor TaxID=1586634 RepID=A0AAV8WSX8_9CUCU|nr:hypothetical protein NQ314_017587 [Rhamnusium bicolor]